MNLFRFALVCLDFFCTLAAKAPLDPVAHHKSPLSRHLWGLAGSRPTTNRRFSAICGGLQPRDPPQTADFSVFVGACRRATHHKPQTFPYLWGLAGSRPTTNRRLFRICGGLPVHRPYDATKSIKKGTTQPDGFSFCFLKVL